FQACSSNSQCCSGVCGGLKAGVCDPSFGLGACHTDNDCAGASFKCDATGHCTLGPVDSRCNADSQCLSGSCNGKQCNPSFGDGLCLDDSDCAGTGGTCDSTGHCTLGSASGRCSSGSQCLSGVCTSGQCAPSFGGGLCRTSSDCAGTGGTCDATGHCTLAS